MGGGGGDGRVLLLAMLFPLGEYVHHPQVVLSDFLERCLPASDVGVSGPVPLVKQFSEAF